MEIEGILCLQPPPLSFIPSIETDDDFSKPRFCPNCGNERNPDASFCEYCGTKIQPSAQNSRSIPPHESTIKNPAEATSTDSEQPIEPYEFMRKDPAVTLILSFVFPGLGHMYVRKIGDGALAMCFTLFVMFVYSMGFTTYVLSTSILFLMFIFWITILLFFAKESYNFTKKYNYTLYKTGYPPW